MPSSTNHKYPSPESTQHRWGRSSSQFTSARLSPRAIPKDRTAWLLSLILDHRGIVAAAAVALTYTSLRYYYEGFYSRFGLLSSEIATDPAEAFSRAAASFIFAPFGILVVVAFMAVFLWLLVAALWGVVTLAIWLVKLPTQHRASLGQQWAAFSRYPWIAGMAAGVKRFRQQDYYWLLPIVALSPALLLIVGAFMSLNSQSGNETTVAMLLTLGSACILVSVAIWKPELYVTFLIFALVVGVLSLFRSFYWFGEQQATDIIRTGGPTTSVDLFSNPAECVSTQSELLPSQVEAGDPIWLLGAASGGYLIASVPSSGTVVRFSFPDSPLTNLSPDECAKLSPGS